MKNDPDEKHEGTTKLSLRKETLVRLRVQSSLRTGKECAETCIHNQSRVPPGTVSGGGGGLGCANGYTNIQF